MATIESEIENAQAQAVLEMLQSQFKSGGINFDTGRILEQISESPDIQQTATSNAEDYAIIYNTSTGLSSSVPLYMLPRYLTRRWQRRHVQDDGIDPSLVGKAIWSMKQTVEPKKNTVLCMLHPDSPHRALAEAAGVDVICRKANLPSDFELRQRHMPRRHKDAWAAIEKHLELQRAGEQNDTINKLLEMLVANQTEQKRGPGRPRKDDEA